jgi:WD40 repeat protein
MSFRRYLTHARAGLLDRRPPALVGVVLIGLTSCGPDGPAHAPREMHRPPGASATDAGPIEQTPDEAAQDPDEGRPIRTQQEAARIWSLALSPDGRRLAAGTQTVNLPPNSLVLWDMQAQRELLRVKEPRASRSVAFSPDGRTIVTGGFGTVARLFDAETGRLLRPFRGHKDGINAVAFSPDGKTLATGSWDMTVKLWDVATGKASATLKGHTDQVYGLAFGPDGRTVASCSRDGTARVWDVDSASEKLVLKGHQGVVEAITYSPDGTLLATAGWDDTLRLWDTDSGRPKAELDGDSDQLAVAFSPDGKTIVTLGAPVGEPSDPLPGKMIFWDVAAAARLATIPAHSDRSYAVLFTPDGMTLVTASIDRTIKFWDVATRKLKMALTTGPLDGSVP